MAAGRRGVPAPVPETAEGIVVFDRLQVEDKEVTGLQADLCEGPRDEDEGEGRAGAVAGVDDAAGPGRDVLGFLDIGVNPNVKLPTGSKLFAWMASGVVTVGLGRNDWAGGDSTSAFSEAGPLPGATLTADGRVVIDRGSLVP